MNVTSIVTRIFDVARRLWSRFAPLPACREPLQITTDLCCRSLRELCLKADPAGKSSSDRLGKRSEASLPVRRWKRSSPAPAAHSSTPRPDEILQAISA